MRTFILIVEIIEVNFENDEFSSVDITNDEVEIVAIDETMAIEELRDRICYCNEFGAKDIHKLQIHEVV